jgi:hypothetical protein
MSQYTKKSKNGRLRRSKQMKYSLNKKQEGGHDYTFTSASSSTKRGNHLLSFLKDYDIESQISGPNFVNCFYYYKGIVEEDLLRIRNYLRVTYANSAQILETGPTSKGQYTFDIISNIEGNAACITDPIVFDMAIKSYNLSFGGGQTYSLSVKTNATDAFRYYLTKNGHFDDLHKNGLVRLDEKPV